MGTPSLRPGTAADAAAVADIWHSGWHDGPSRARPDGLTARRTLEAFHDRAPARVADTTVADVDGEVAGFIMVVGDEVEQVYVGDGPPRLRTRRPAARRGRAPGRRARPHRRLAGRRRRQRARARASTRGAAGSTAATCPTRSPLSARPSCPRAVATSSGSALTVSTRRGTSGPRSGADARAGDVLVARLLDPLPQHRPAALDRPVPTAPVERLLPRRLPRGAPLRAGRARGRRRRCSHRSAWSRRRPRSRRRRTRGPRPRRPRRWRRGRRSTRSRGTGSTSTQTTGVLSPARRMVATFVQRLLVAGVGQRARGRCRRRRARSRRARRRRRRRESSPRRTPPPSAAARAPRRPARPGTGSSVKPGPLVSPMTTYSASGSGIGMPERAALGDAHPLRALRPADVGAEDRPACAARAAAAAAARRPPARPAAPAPGAGPSPGPRSASRRRSAAARTRRSRRRRGPSPAAPASPEHPASRASRQQRAPRRAAPHRRLRPARASRPPRRPARSPRRSGRRCPGGRRGSGTTPRRPRRPGRRRSP